MARLCELCTALEDKSTPAIPNGGFEVNLCKSHWQRIRHPEQFKKPARDPKKVYCPHCEAPLDELKMNPQSGTLGPLGPPIAFVIFSCPRCHTALSFSVGISLNTQIAGPEGVRL
jgi:hypothetical protein